MQKREDNYRIRVFDQVREDEYERKGGGVGCRCDRGQFIYCNREEVC